MDENTEQLRRKQMRNAHNEEFLQNLFVRRPSARKRYERMLQSEAVPEAATEAKAEAIAEASDKPGSQDNARQIVAETIVNEERPVLFIRSDWIDRDEVTVIGDEADELIRDLDSRRAALQPLMPLIGRIDVTNFPNIDYVGSGWFVDKDIVVTNRHVANLIARWDGRKFAFSHGIGGRAVASSFNTLHEFDDLAPNTERSFAVTDVLYIEPEPGPDIAFLRVNRRTDGARADRIEIAPNDIGEGKKVFVVGYPARASKRVIPDQDLMKRLYRDRYDVKRAAPGFTMGPQNNSTRHDCTTLGGNSGSVVLDLETGKAVGLHFAGLYQEANYAVGARTLTDYITRKRWSRPVALELARRDPAPPTTPRPKPQALPPQGAQTGTPAGAVTVTIPLSITVSLGQPASGGAPLVSGSVGWHDPAASTRSPSDAEAAARSFWDERPDGVIGVRVGYFEEGGDIGDVPYIAASAPASRIGDVSARGPAQYDGFAVRYLPANVTEQIEGLGIVESVDRISYDDDARTGKNFSFEPVEEMMTVRAHVGPEYSWDELKGFLAGAKRKMVSAMYEFHGIEIKNAIESRLNDGASLIMVLDNATFTEVKDEDEEFERGDTFKRWKTRFRSRFDRVVAKEGVDGLISDSYHIKVTVREDDTFWLSSGNWKQGSSQPVITDEQRENASEVDLPGNREWHVIVANSTLATRFRSHILQDFKRSRDLGGDDVPASEEAAEIFVDVPIEEAPVLERRPANRLLKPLQIERSIKVKPLLTPDKEGAVYSEAVLEMIRSARKSLLFQIPYIGMPSNPRADRGYIDELIKALTQKLKTLDDARVLLRAGGSKFSAPTHAAWYFKSKGVDISERLRSIENHHTKGMIVDGERVLIGSHNWSKPGVTLNRDASLIFDDKEIADYFGQAFEIDWDRANPIKPKRFVKSEGVMQEAVGAEPPSGFRRVRLSELLKEDD
ncbi:MAG: phospholipase D-like domain-containing protein [Rhodoblastus sp.]